MKYAINNLIEGIVVHIGENKNTMGLMNGACQCWENHPSFVSNMQRVVFVLIIVAKAGGDRKNGLLWHMSSLDAATFL